jgi:acetyltransferase-like isoleucine patch superfamily enzyme
MIMNRLMRAAAGLRERLTRRYYRTMLFSRCAEVGDGVVVGPDVWWNFWFVQPENLRFGQGTVINGECYLNAQGGVRFGRYCHVGKGLTVYSSNHNYRSVVAIPYDDQDLSKPVDIGDCVWIGANVSILPGTTIGRGAVVAMGAVVRGNVPSCAIVAGNPATIVGMRDVEIFERLYLSQAFA